MFSLALYSLLFWQHVCAVTIPLSPPSYASPKLDPAPVGVSLEFFTFPDYMNVVGSTATCLNNLGDLTGTMPPMRIGGTTQDRATYDSNLASAVKYSVADPKDAPATLTYGPSFMQLASKYTGSVIIGFNRRLNNLSNTIAAAKVAVQYMTNLYSIELGNEPDLYTGSDPIAGGSWSVSKDVSSQTSWQASVAQGIGKTNIIEAGVYLQPPTWSTSNLAPKEGSSAQYVKSFSGHSYPQSACGGASTNLKNLMTHSGIVSYTKKYGTEANAAKAIGKPYVLGETNSATCGGGGISPTFGAALWIVDYVLQGVINGASRLYFHQGTIGNCAYCWWGRYSMGAPYYGAYFVSAALAGADSVAMLDAGNTAYATYAVYKAGKPVRVVLYNSDFYTSGTRPTRAFALEGLAAGALLKAKRLTAPNANSRQDQGGNPSFGGQRFSNGTCLIDGSEKYEDYTVEGSGSVSISVGASEAVLVYLV